MESYLKKPFVFVLFVALMNGTGPKSESSEQGDSWEVSDMNWGAKVSFWS